MAKLLKMNRSWTHYINLSGQDFPLKSQAYIQSFLRANPRRQYIRALDQREIRPDTMNRVSHMFVEAVGRMFRTGLPRAFLKGATPYIGTQWKAVEEDEIADHRGMPFGSPIRAVSSPESRSFSCPGKPNQNHSDR